MTITAVLVWLTGIPITMILYPRIMKFFHGQAEEEEQQRTQAARKTGDAWESKESTRKAQNARDLRQQLEQIGELEKIDPRLSMAARIPFAALWPAYLVLSIVGWITWPVVKHIGKTVYVCDGCGSEKSAWLDTIARRRAFRAGWVFVLPGHKDETCYCRVCILTGRVPMTAVDPASTKPR